MAEQMDGSVGLRVQLLNTHHPTPPNPPILSATEQQMLT